MIRLAIFALVGSIFLFCMGFTEITNSVRYTHPTVLTYDQFVQQHPTSGWYTITDGVLDLLDTVEKTENGEHSEWYVGLMGPKDDPMKPVLHVVVIPDDPSLDQTLEDGSKLPDNPSDADMQQFLESHKGTIFVRKAVTGMVNTDLTSGSDDHSQIAQKMDGLTSDYIVIDQNHKPSVGMGLLEILGGFGCLAFLVWVFRSYNRPRVATRVQVPPGWGQQPAPQAPPQYGGAPYGQPPYGQPASPTNQYPPAYPQAAPPAGQYPQAASSPAAPPPIAPAPARSSGMWLNGDNDEGAPVAAPPAASAAPATPAATNSWLLGETPKPEGGEPE